MKKVVANRKARSSTLQNVHRPQNDPRAQRPTNELECLEKSHGRGQVHSHDWQCCSCNSHQPWSFTLPSHLLLVASIIVYTSGGGGRYPASSVDSNPYPLYWPRSAILTDHMSLVSPPSPITCGAGKLLLQIILFFQQHLVKMSWLTASITSLYKCCSTLAVGVYDLNL